MVSSLTSANSTKAPRVEIVEPPRPPQSPHTPIGVWSVEVAVELVRGTGAIAPEDCDCPAAYRRLGCRSSSRRKVLSCEFDSAAPIGAGHDLDASGDSRTSSRPFGPRAAFRLALAGHLLQRRGVRIQCAPGERYPDAVLRVIGEVPQVERETLRSAVNFLEELGPELAPSPGIRKRFCGLLTPPGRGE